MPKRREVSPIEAAKTAAQDMAQNMGHELGEWYLIYGGHQATCKVCGDGIFIDPSSTPVISIGGFAMTRPCRRAD